MGEIPLNHHVGSSLKDEPLKDLEFEMSDKEEGVVERVYNVSLRLVGYAAVIFVFLRMKVISSGAFSKVSICVVAKADDFVIMLLFS